jgi:hypothetical protein
MENKDKINSQQNGIASNSVESTSNDAAANSFGNFIAHDSDPASDNPIADDPKEKIAKQDQYFDDKENPRTHYNVNDMAHAKSSKDDFIKTTSNFQHADGGNDSDNDYPAQVPD